ncbi:MAG: hypothetical protein U9O66_03560 [Patescibacteria group bacterium]|nr:hypothetical protein [Patescibacteria group bacterium]
MNNDLKNILEKRSDNFETEKSDLIIEKKERKKSLDKDFQKERSADAGQKKIESEIIVSDGASKGVKTHLSQKSAEVEKIENILSEGLEDAYVNLSARKQLEFKKNGEETAAKIFFILKSTKVKVKKIIRLIKEWLKMIPGVNRFFLEQEAKIKADKIMEMK